MAISQKSARYIHQKEWRSEVITATDKGDLEPCATIWEFASTIRQLDRAYHRPYPCTIAIDGSTTHISLGNYHSVQNGAPAKMHFTLKVQIM